jgi:hypothetical protein
MSNNVPVPKTKTADFAYWKKEDRFKIVDNELWKGLKMGIQSAGLLRFFTGCVVFWLVLSSITCQKNKTEVLTFGKRNICALFLVSKNYGLNHFLMRDVMDIHEIKTDEDGNEVWAKTFGNKPFYDFGNAVLEMADGGCIVAGTTKSIVNNRGTTITMCML